MKINGLQLMAKYSEQSFNESKRNWKVIISENINRNPCHYNGHSCHVANNDVCCMANHHRWLAQASAQCHQPSAAVACQLSGGVQRGMASAGLLAREISMAIQ